MAQKNRNNVAWERNEKGQVKAIQPSALAEKPLNVRVSPETDAAIRAMPNRSQFLREAIERAYAELVGAQ